MTQQVWVDLFSGLIIWKYNHASVICSTGTISSFLLDSMWLPYLYYWSAPWSGACCFGSQTPFDAPYLSFEKKKRNHQNFPTSLLDLLSFGYQSHAESSFSSSVGCLCTHALHRHTYSTTGYWQDNSSSNWHVLIIVTCIWVNPALFT